MSKYDDYILHIIGSDLDALMHYGVPGQRKGHHDPRRRWQKQAFYADGRDDPNAVPKLKAPMNPKYFVNNWAGNQMIWTDLDNQEHGNWNRPMMQRATVSSNKPRKPRINATRLSTIQRNATTRRNRRNGMIEEGPAFNLDRSAYNYTRGNPGDATTVSSPQEEPSYRVVRNADGTYTLITQFVNGRGYAQAVPISEEEAQRYLNGQDGGSQGQNQNPNQNQNGNRNRNRRPHGQPGDSMQADPGAKKASDYIDRSQYSSDEAYKQARRQARLADYITDNNALKRKYGKDKAGYERELANLKDQYRDIRKLIKQYKNL